MSNIIQATVIEACNKYLQFDSINPFPYPLEKTLRNDLLSLANLLEYHKVYAILEDPKFLSQFLSADMFTTISDETYKKRAQVCWSELTRIVRWFTSNKINYCLVKGVALSELLYSEPYKRGIGDIDLIVNGVDFERAFYLLISNGYVRTQAREMKSPLIFFGVHHHEIVLYRYIDGKKFLWKLRKKRLLLIHLIYGGPMSQKRKLMVSL